MLIESDRLRVTVDEPGEIYRESRFDWTGFIRSIVLDGDVSFCAPESLDPGLGSKGAGLCGEFGLAAPVGYDDAGPGEWFPKIGVGLLHKIDNTPYSFASPYELRPFSTGITLSSDSVVFSQTVPEHLGYAYFYRKIIRLQGNRLSITSLLENRGSKNISTNEYCHNFLNLNGRSLDETYSLSIPKDIRPEKAAGTDATDALILAEGLISFRHPVQDVFYAGQDISRTTVPTVWKLEHSDESVEVLCEEQFPLSRFALWGRPHVISPEFFMDIRLAPGEKTEWERRYTFSRNR